MNFHPPVKENTNLFVLTYIIVIKFVITLKAFLKIYIYVLKQPLWEFTVNTLVLYRLINTFVFEFEQFPAMRALSIQSADAFILVYDVTDANSFCELKLLRDQIHETKATSSVPIVVVGNKTDLLIEDSDRREVR